MNHIMEKIGTARMMRDMDSTTINEYKIPGIVLMENAGRGAFEFLMDEFGPERVSVFAGKGNNGGDGYVIARHLLNQGVHVDTYVLANRSDISGDAKTNLDALDNMGGPIFEVVDMAMLEDYRYHMMESDLIVDAILGTGLDSDVRGNLADVIGFLNGLVEDTPHIRVFAVDMPSGVNSDTGQIMGITIPADATATFGMMKTGQLSYPGAELVGSLAVIDISIPADLYVDVPYSLITPELALDLMPVRLEDAHKGTVGHGIVVAGSPGKTGAAVMAAESAYRTGAGLVTLASPESVNSILETKTIEVMTEPLPGADTGTFGEKSVKRACEVLEGKTAWALGPGIGQNDDVNVFVKEMLAKCSLPVVIDADGLNAVASETSMLKKKAGPAVLTPHPGEMARLVGKSTKEVLEDRLNICLDFAREYDVCLVLKGAHTLIACPDGSAHFNITGNPGMATGGSGDVLTGMVLGFLCQGLDVEEAAVLSVFLHGGAGDLAAGELGEESLMAGDIMDAIPRAISDMWEAGEECLP